MHFFAPHVILIHGFRQPVRNVMIGFLSWRVHWFFRQAVRRTNSDYSAGSRFRRNVRFVVTKAKYARYA